MAYCAIEGADRLYANLDWLQRYFGSEAIIITMTEQRAVAEDIRNMAERLAPVGRTGELKAGIVVIPGINQTEIASLAPYSLYVEFGTVYMAARPFLRPAFHAYGYFSRVSSALSNRLVSGLQ